MSVGKMGFKSWAGPGNSIPNTGVFYITLKELIFTHMIKYFLMCTRKEFLREILYILVNITGLYFLGWYRMKWVASCIAVMNSNFLKLN